MVVSRDVSFLELQTVDEATTCDNPADVSGQGGETKEGNDQNIELPVEIVAEDYHRNSREKAAIDSSSDNDLKDATNSPASTLRRSARIRTQTHELFKNEALLSYALAVEAVPSCYKAATTPDKIFFGSLEWKANTPYC